MVTYIDKSDSRRGARALLYKLWRQKRYKFRTIYPQHVDGGWGVWRALI